MPLSDMWRRVLQRRDDFDFQLLKSASAMELSAYHRSSSSRRLGRPIARTHIPRYYSQHEDLRIQSATDGADELKLIEGADCSDMSELTIVFGYMEGSSTTATRKMSAPATSRAPPDFAPEGAFDARDAVLDKSLNQCHLFRQQPNFVEGILLKCIESKPLYPYLHYAVFRDAEKEQRISNARNLMLELRPSMAAEGGTKELFGTFEEVYSIIKTTSTFETRLPAQRHTGYIVIAFKLLEDQNHKNLEKSWLQWTGAREIYKYAPRNWNLRRITLHRCHRLPKSGRSTPSASAAVPSDSFAYVLLCEFGNILHPANMVQAFDVCERLRVRNCGHVALYQVQWTYGRTVPAGNPTGRPTGRPALLSAEGGMPRGFSHDLEATETSPRRRHSPLRHRDRSLGYSGIDESIRFDSYHHLHRDDY